MVIPQNTNTGPPPPTIQMILTPPPILPEHTPLPLLPINKKAGSHPLMELP